MKHLLLTTAMATILGGSPGLAQGTFQNLDFEAARLPFPPTPQGQLVSLSEALPA